MTGFVVVPEQVDALSRQLADAADDLRGELGAVEARVEDVLAAGWRGLAASGFARDWEQWTGGARAVLAALASMAELAAGTAGSYRRAEAASVLVR